MCEHNANMSTGGIFQLLTNDGNQDRLLMATELLNDRLKEISRLRCKNPAIKDRTPTLVDIERTHIMFMNAHFKPFVAIGFEYNKIGVSEGAAAFGQEVTFSIPQFGDFFHDMVLNVRLSGLSAGTTSIQAKYADFLGHRLLRRTRFEVNANNLDEYSSDVYNFHYHFGVPEQKRRAWKGAVGQEIPKPAYFVQDPLVDEYREVKNIVNGPQTPKITHDDVDMWIPLLFWFNKDPRLAIPSVSIPYGQRFIKILIANVDEICQGTPTDDFTAPVIQIMELYINNIFVNPEIHDIFIKRVGFSLIRVHREEQVSVNRNADDLKMDKLKFPVETLFLGIRPTVNDTEVDDWHRYHFVTNTAITYPAAVPNPLGPVPAHVLAFSPAVMKEETPVIDTLSVETVGIELWRETPAKFFNTYIPYNYGGYNISSPEDPGVYMLPFNLYPGVYQPSGHINLSRTREFYVKYTSSIISTVIPGTLVVLAIAINFLLISSGSAQLRYNT